MERLEKMEQVLPKELINMLRFSVTQTKQSVHGFIHEMYSEVRHHKNIDTQSIRDIAY